MGKLMDRPGPRTVMEVGVVLMAGGLCVARSPRSPGISTSPSAAGRSPASSFTAIPCVAVLPTWFVAARARCRPAFAGVGIGSLFLLPWVHFLTRPRGWRAASWAKGLLGAVRAGAAQLCWQCARKTSAYSRRRRRDGCERITAAVESVDPAWAAID